VRKALRRLLNSVGAQVETFATGADFLASLASHRPDCVILDLHLPGMSGREIQRSVAAARPGLPVIVITGKDEPGARESVLAAGARNYILKPLDDITLLAAVAAAASAV
jgi:FixJ family two-component response regulator